MLWPKKNSCKEFDNEKKFLRLENSPPPITFLMVRPLGTNFGLRFLGLYLTQMLHFWNLSSG